MEGITSSASYTPAALLLSNSVFTSDQLITHFEDFRSTLRYANVAPELVFERLVGNLSTTFQDAVKQDQKHNIDILRTLESYTQDLRNEIERLGRKNQVLVETLEKCSCSHDLVEGSNMGPGPSGSPSYCCASISLKTIKTRPSLRTGACATSDSSMWTEASYVRSCKVPFANSYGQKPNVSLGITALEINPSDCLEFCCSLEDLTIDHLLINITSSRDILAPLKDTGVCSAKLSWLESESDDPYVQFGSYSTRDDNPSRGQFIKFTEHVAFRKVYDSPPVVLIWFTGLDMCKGGAFKVKTYIEKITETAFTIRTISWGYSLLHFAKVEWVAFMAGTPCVCHGNITTINQAYPYFLTNENTGSVKFGKHVFDEPPRTMIAINSISADHTWSSTGLKVGTGITSVSTAGMEWYLVACTGTALGGVGASYIAFA